ncbi:hypothetical protein [Streptomyces barringtoniae]|uniref:hypothetical protein n=1 Tax=Streptomyces barringtoniae TaxID=2892029 RepID=UPI001E29FFA2|nr:hypothetical protein [Streptomyces barringtoniae]MCC5480561.1 hypothetical protein [Streptomyces barringtoniae]
MARAPRLALRDRGTRGNCRPDLRLDIYDGSEQPGREGDGNAYASTLATLPPPWPDLAARIPDHGPDAWSPDDYRRASEAWEFEDKVRDLASHIAAPAAGEDSRTLVQQLLEQHLYKDSVTVLDGPRTLVGLNIGGHPSRVKFGFAARVTADAPAPPEPPATRALYGAVLTAWWLDWHQRTAQPPTITIRSIDEVAVPWPVGFRIELPNLTSHWIRLHDVTPFEWGRRDQGSQQVAGL